MTPTRRARARSDEAPVERCSRARFEFRAWSVDPGVTARLEPAGGFCAGEEVSDAYLVSSRRSANVKIRNGVVKVKRLIEVCDRFERWCPTWRALAPLDECAVMRLWGELGLAPPTSIDAPATQVGLMAMARADADLELVEVVKRRRHGTLRDVSIELTDVVSGDRSGTSVTLEGTDLARLQMVRAVTGLDAFDNVPVHVALTEARDDVFGDHGARVDQRVVRHRG